MAWEKVDFGTIGVRVTIADVSIAWRTVSGSKNPNKQRFVAVIHLSKKVLSQLMWEPGTALDIERERDLGMLRFTPTAGVGRRPAFSKGAANINVPLMDVTSDKRAAEPMTYDVANGVLTVTLPDWAAPTRVGKKLAAEAAGKVKARLNPDAEFGTGRRAA